MLPWGLSFWQSNRSRQGSSLRPSTRTKPSKTKPSKTNKQDEAKQDGTADFEKATELKINARRPIDFDQVVQLCESAIKKGLDPATESFCRRLMLDSLLEYAVV